MNSKLVARVAAVATALATALPVAAQTREPAPADPVETAPAVDAEESREKVGRSLEPADFTPGDAVEKTPQVQALGAGQEQRTYLVRLVDDAVPTYDGGVPGLAPTAPEPGERLDPSSAPVRQYQDFLVEEQVGLIQRMDRIAGRDVEVPFTYQFAVNGFAAVLTPEEAAELAIDPAVASIALDQERELHTDRGPQSIGAPTLWDASAALGLPEDVNGEGVVIGTIDTGISPGNRSFADVGDDGYDHTNPYGEFLGVCDPDNPASGGGFDPDFPCNDKLVGAYVFGNVNDTAVDYDGHGSHTSSTSGGNVVDGVTPFAPTGTFPEFDISGVAPHANVISYLGCCSVSGLTAAIDQAIADQVDVINYSIGSTAPSALWDDFDSVGYLNARAAGIFVATSNGNSGPFPDTTGSPADAPWIISVGAASHDRRPIANLIDLTSSEGSIPDISGKGQTGALPATDIVYAGDFGDPLCGDTSGHEAEIDGNIVVCERGVFGRVAKSQNVAAQGAAGFVLINDEPNGASLVADPYAVPGVFIPFEDGEALKAWLATGTSHQAAITNTEFVIDEEFGDELASFSSRGANRAVDVIVPDVVAPGVDILAALGADSYTSDIHGIISGTSMASPHTAGAGALLTQARPGWTPAQMQSALMTTARTTVSTHDGSESTPYDIGAGHINVDLAAQAGLLFDETHANYLAANPAEGGDPKTLNLPSFADSQCLGVCSWDRTASVPVNPNGSVPSNVTWTASTESDAGLTIGVSLSDATVSPGDTVDIVVSADVTGAPEGETLFGRITLTPDNADVPEVTMPLAVVPTPAILPGEVDFETRRNAGSHLIEGIQSAEVTDFTGSVLGLVPGTIDDGSLDEDPTNGDPYDDLNQVDVYTFEVPDGTSRFISETLSAEMPDLDLFVGTGSTPSLATQLCASTSPTAVEGCDLSEPDPGTYWVLIQNWGGSTEQPDAYVISTGIVPGTDLGNSGLEGPAGTVPSSEPYDVTFHWDVDEMVAGESWYGVAVLGSSPGSPDDIGSFPVTVRRIDDDVTKTASVETATVGDTISYEIEVQPNVTSGDLAYTITDTVPDGLTIDPASVTGGGVVDGQTITWEVEVPSPVGQVGEYIVSTPATSQQCLDWSGFLDLADFGIGFAGLDGDSVVGTAFAGIGPFEHYGELYPNLEVTEDGFVAVTGGYGGFPFIPQVIPDSDFPNGVMAPLWSDLELSLADERGMRLATAGDVAVIQWDDPFEWTPGTDVGPSVGQFQAWIYTTVEDFRPEMTFDYATLGALPSAATIGTENLLGDLATSVLGAGDPGGVLEEGGSICLDYEGPSFGAVTFGYDVTVDADASPGIFTNEVVHVTDDPFAQPATASTDVEITEPQSDLAIVKTGEVADGQIVYTVEVTNNGPNDATGVVVTDELPESVEYVSDTCGAANLPPWTWEIGELATEEVVECSITVDVPGPSEVIDNIATVIGDNEDPDADNNESTATVDYLLACTDEIDGRHVGRLVVAEGVTCLDGATVVGPVTVEEGAALLSDGSRITGPLNSRGALEISLCDTRVTGPSNLNGSSKVTVGDPTVECEGNTHVGPVTVNGTNGPSVIADNRITGPLNCANNEPAPVNNGFPNDVVGPTRGQCSEL